MQWTHIRSSGKTPWVTVWHHCCAVHAQCAHGVKWDTSQVGNFAWHLWLHTMYACTTVLFRIRIFWSPIREIYEIFLDPELDWISFLLKPDPDPDYPKRFEHFLIFLRFVFFLRKFYWWLESSDAGWCGLYCSLIYHSWLTFTRQSWGDGSRTYFSRR